MWATYYSCVCYRTYSSDVLIFYYYFMYSQNVECPHASSSCVFSYLHLNLFDFSSAEPYHYQALHSRSIGSTYYYEWCLKQTPRFTWSFSCFKVRYTAIYAATFRSSKVSIAVVWNITKALFTHTSKTGMNLTMKRPCIYSISPH